jgi:hypothetical protein
MHENTTGSVGFGQDDELGASTWVLAQQCELRPPQMYTFIINGCLTMLLATIGLSGYALMATIGMSR